VLVVIAAAEVFLQPNVKTHEQTRCPSLTLSSQLRDGGRPRDLICREKLCAILRVGGLAISSGEHIRVCRHFDDRSPLDIDVARIAQSRAARAMRRQPVHLNHGPDKVVEIRRSFGLAEVRPNQARAYC
jgi:hypothetical protein